jgi:tricorn protease
MPTGPSSAPPLVRRAAPLLSALGRPRDLLRALALSLALVVVGAAAVAADPIRFMMHPHAQDGRIAFSYQGDIWVVEEDGSSPRRLTFHVAQESAPRFSPDGRWIAFSSNRFGNDDVFIIPVEGGEPRQLTFHTGSDVVGGWSRDGSHVLFVTSRHTHPFYSPMYQVSVEGGIPTALTMDQARDVAFSPDGSQVVFNRRGVSTTRKGYRGNASTDLFIQDVASGEIRQLTDPRIEDYREHAHDAVPMWGADDRMYFLSERSGVFNIWRMAPDGSGAEQVTEFTEGGVKYPSISADGSMIAFTQQHELWTMTVPDGTPRRVTVEIDADLTTNLVEWVEVDGTAQGFAGAPDGDHVAVDQRGEIVIVPTDAEVGEMTRVTESAWRDRYAKYSPDGAHIAYVSDRSGEEEFWLYTVADGSHRQLSNHASQKDANYIWSPDGAKIAFVASNRLFEIDVASGSQRELGYNEAGGYSLGEYSADGRWLVYDKRDERLGRDVFLRELATGNETDVTRHADQDRSGALTPDGSHVVFISNRNAAGNQVYVTSLSRLTENPTDPLVRARQGEDEEGRADEGDAPLDIRIDVEGIDARARQLTSGESVGSFFLSADGESVFFTGRDDEGPGLFRVSILGGEADRVAEGSFGGLTPTPDRKAAFFTRSGGQVHHMALPSGRTERIDFEFDVRVDHRAEWEQIFHEAWRVMKYRFYDEDMHGRDWEAIRDEYAPLLAHVGTYEETYQLANEMIGELNASHVGVRGAPSRPQDREYQTAFLGFEMEPDGARYRVSHIYRDGPADHEWLDLEVGDYVLSLDGTDLAAGDNYWEHLNHTLNDFVSVRVADDVGGRGARDLRIETVTSLGDIKYEEWVANNRDFVTERSGGKIAYVHIRSMNQPSLRRFEAEIDRYWDAQGIVVDIRYNGGGNIDQQLIDILERRPYEYWNSRWGAREWGRRPRQAIAGPKVMLINARSGSDSEVTPMGFRDLGLGRIVGNPTAAAVIATGSYGLIHGGTIRTPGSLVVTYDPTQPNNYGVNLENFGVPPDVFVENTPNDELAGFDRELAEAVDEALRMLSQGRWQYTSDPDGLGAGAGGVQPGGSPGGD